MLEPTHPVPFNNPFAGDSEMARWLRSYNWSQTSLGSVEQWPQSLRTAISILLGAHQPMILFWGPDWVPFYNDSYLSLWGNRPHPQALGQRGVQCGTKTWPLMAPQIERVMTSGEAVWQENQLVPRDRNGSLEESYFTYSYSPVRDETGGVGGTLVICTETTAAVLSQRRLQPLPVQGTNGTQPESVATILNLQEQEDILQLFFKYVPSGVAMFDRQMRYLAVSQRWLEDYHLSSLEAVLGQCHYDIFPDISDRWRQVHQRCLAGATEHCDADCLQRQDGSRQWLRWEARPWYQLNQEIGGVIIFSEDITDRRQAEITLREREQQLATLAEVSPVVIFRFDTAMNCIYVNGRWTEMTGRPLEAALGMGWAEALHPQDRDRLTQEWLEWCERADSQTLYENSGRCIRPDGSVIWYYVQAKPKVDSKGLTVGYIGALTDITSLRQAETALKASQQQLQQQLAEIEAIYQSAPIGLNILDTDLRFVRINQRLAEMNGLSVEAHLGRSVRELLPDLADAAEKLLRPILETGEPLLNVEITGATPAQPGVQRTWVESFLPLKDGDRVIGISTVCEEVTERKRTEEALRQAKAELEIRVAERTQELQAANDRLQQELSQRLQIEQQLRQSEARYKAIVEDQTEMITRFAADSTILYVNNAYCRYFGVEQTEILGKSYSPAIYAADRDQVAQLVGSMSAANPMVIIENRVINHHGEVRWTQWVNRMLFDTEENLIEFQSVGRDITDLKQAEQALRDSEERLQLALEASGDGIWDWNLVTNETYYSPQYFQMLGYTANELPYLLKTWEGLIHPDDLPWVKAILARHLQDPSVRYSFDYRLRTKSGEWKWIADYGKVVAWDENGKPLRMIGTHRDVNDRKLMEAALRQSEERRRLALDLTYLGFWDLHLPTGELTWNDNHFALLGLPISTKAPRYKDWRDRIHPEDVDRIEQCFLNSIETHTDYESEYRVIHPDGSEHWILARGRAIYDDQNQPSRSLGVILDISDRKQIEASLEESNRRWRSLLDNVQLAVVELDVAGNIEFANPFFLQLTEYLPAEVLGQNWFNTFLVPAQRQSAIAHFRQALVQNTYTYYQNSILTKSGKECIFAWNNTVLRDASGQPIGKVSIGEDITERSKIERMKAEFISMVSHELRTPLTSMQAALSLLSDKIIDPTSEEGEATIQIATEGTDRLVRLVNDILDLERLESGKVRLEKHHCEVSDLINTAVAQMYELANQAAITLAVDACVVQMWADSDRLLQVLTNLLSNAIKFSPPASQIWLSAEVRPANAAPPVVPPQPEPTETSTATNQSACVFFKVQDQGRGIPADKLESIFERFHQVDASDSREKGGTGLGLAICRSIVRQHGGEIWVESSMGKGSVFYFTIPLAGEAVA